VHLPPGLLLLLLPALVSARTFPEERQLLDRRLEALRRVLPDGPHPEYDVTHVTELARAAGLTGLRIEARAPLENGARGETQVDVSGTVPYADLDRLFRQVSGSARPIDLQDLRIRASGSPGAVTFTSVLTLPWRPVTAPLPRVPEGARPSFTGVARADVDAFLRDQALMLDKTNRTAELRRARRNPRVLLAEMSTALRGRPAVLLEATLGEEFFLRGMALGDGGMSALESRLERGFLRVANVLQMRQGGCYRFEVRGRSPVVGPEAELPLPTTSPFGEADALCRVDRDSGRRVAVRGPKRPARAPRGPLSVLARGVDAADFFQVLSAAGAGDFVVDGDVIGRVDAELSGLTPEQLRAAAQDAGFALSPAGALVRVSATPAGKGDLPAPREPAADVGFAAKRSPAAELMDAAAELLPGAARIALPSPGRRLSLFARGANPAEVRAALLLVLGVTEPVVAEPSAAVPAPGASAEAARPGAADLTLGEFELSALAGRNGQWTAFAYGPDGTLHAYRAGDVLADARVSAVTSTDVLFETEEGGIRVLYR
jgi:hypothetical protein